MSINFICAIVFMILGTIDFIHYMFENNSEKELKYMILYAFDTIIAFLNFILDKLK